MTRELFKPSYTTAFVGLTHMGFVCTVCWAYLNVKVLGIDIQFDSSGKKYLYEKDFVKLLKKYKRNIKFTKDFSSLQRSKIVFFAQDTNLSGKDRTKTLEEHLRKSIPHLRNGVTIIIMSQVPIGFCRKIRSLIKNKKPDLNFKLYHWVDTIIMTQAIERVLHPERIIIGKIDKDEKMSTNLVKQLKLFKCPVIEMSYESAEITKASINLYLANSITFANTLSDFCESFGADINDVSVALKLDKRIGPYSYIRPTLRIAGGHLERDLTMLKSLAEDKKINPGVTRFIVEQNNLRYKWVIKKIKENLESKKETPVICFWGLSYKKNSTSTESAPSIQLIKDMSKKYKIRTYDPMAIMPKNLKGYKRFDDKYTAIKGSDLLLVVTEWDEFANASFKKIKKMMKGDVIIDCVNLLSNKNANMYFNYISMGVGQ